MNRYERQTGQAPRSLRNSMLLWSAGGILLIGALALLGIRVTRRNGSGHGREFGGGAAAGSAPVGQAIEVRQIASRKTG